MTILPNSIAGRLTAWFLIISLIPSISLVLVMFMVFRETIEQTVQEGIQFVRRDRVEDLQRFLSQRTRELEVLARGPLVIQAAESIPADEGPLPPDSAANLARLAKEYQTPLRYDNFMFFRPDGDLLFELNPNFVVDKNVFEGALEGTALARAVQEAVDSRKSVTSEAERYTNTPTEGYLIFQAAPVTVGGEILAVLVVQVNQREFLLLFEDYLGLGETGDIYAGKLEGREIRIAAELRNDPSGTLAQQSYSIGGPRAEALQIALQGRAGNGILRDYRGIPSVASWDYDPTLKLGIVAERAVSEAYGLLALFRWISLGLLLVTAALVVPVALYVARSMSRPIVEASEVASRVAAGDLSTDVSNDRAEGEVGKLQRALRNMTGHLRSLIGNAQQSVVTVMSASAEIAATARSQQQTVDDLGVSTSEVAAAVNQITATSQELLQTMGEVRQSAQRAAELAADGQQGLAGMHQTMTKLADSTSSISSRLSVISERANNINLVVTTITKVADQTNLLSINAAIEAEKAGEYGRGFIVVAREIRRLADQTAVATLDIERIVKDMQHSVTAGVMEMDKFHEQVRSGVREVASIGDQLNEVIHRVQEVLPRFVQVTEGMSAQSQGAGQIREAMLQLRDGAAHTATSLREFQETTEQLRKSISSLQGDIAKFQV